MTERLRRAAGFGGELLDLRAAGHLDVRGAGGLDAVELIGDDLGQERELRPDVRVLLDTQDQRAITDDRLDERDQVVVAADLEAWFCTLGDGERDLKGVLRVERVECLDGPGLVLGDAAAGYGRRSESKPPRTPGGYEKCRNHQAGTPLHCLYLAPLVQGPGLVVRLQDVIRVT